LGHKAGYNRSPAKTGGKEFDMEAFDEQDEKPWGVAMSALAKPWLDGAEDAEAVCLDVIEQARPGIDENGLGMTGTYVAGELLVAVLDYVSREMHFSTAAEIDEFIGR
jgi:hypothetical protein